MKMMRLVLTESDNNTLNIANADEVRFASFSDLADESLRFLPRIKRWFFQRILPGFPMFNSWLFQRIRQDFPMFNSWFRFVLVAKMIISEESDRFAKVLCWLFKSLPKFKSCLLQRSPYGLQKFNSWLFQRSLPRFNSWFFQRSL